MSDSGIRTLAQIPEASDAVTAGDTVRLTSDRTVGLAQADSSANIEGTLGVTLTAARPVNVVVCGDAEAKLETGLIPIAGQSLWVSPTVAGRLTNVVPAANALFVGVIKDASAYSTEHPFVLANVSAVVSIGTLSAGTEIALWDITKVRYFFVSYDDGDDANTGFIDATAGTVFTAGQLVGIPIKTIARLNQVLPHFGNGRSAVVLVKPRNGGATAYDTAFDFLGVAGYVYMMVRGSTDLTNSIHDRLAAGGVQAVVGPNSDGSFTVTSGGTTSAFSIVAGSLGATDADVGWRTRFDENTSTAALRDIASFIAINSSTQVTPASNLGAAPALGDTFFVERPGVRVSTYRGSTTQTITVAGIGVTGSAALSMQLSAGIASFIELVTSTTAATLTALAQTAGAITVTSGYVDEVGTFRSIGQGLRTAGAVSMSSSAAVLGVSPLAAINTSAAVSFTGLMPSIATGGGSYLANGATLRDIGDTGLFGPGTITTNRNVRVRGGPVTFNGVMWQMRNVDVSNSSSAGILVNSSARQGVLLFLQAVTGTGNATYGLDVGTFSRNLVAGASTDTTITGTLGDVRFSLGPVGTWVDLTLTNVMDQTGNNVYGQNATGERVVGQATLVTNKNGSALAVGQLVRGNGTTGQVVAALADTTAHATGLFGVMVTAPADNALGYMVTPGNGAPYVLYDSAPTPSALTYLSPTAAGKATTTVPPAAATNQKLRIGYNIDVSGSTGHLAFAPELVPATSDGTAP